MSTHDLPGRRRMKSWRDFCGPVTMRPTITCQPIAQCVCRVVKGKIQLPAAVWPVLSRMIRLSWSLSKHTKSQSPMRCSSLDYTKNFMRSRSAVGIAAPSAPGEYQASVDEVPFTSFKQLVAWLTGI